MNTEEIIKIGFHIGIVVFALIRIFKRLLFWWEMRKMRMTEKQARSQSVRETTVIVTARQTAVFFLFLTWYDYICTDERTGEEYVSEMTRKWVPKGGELSIFFDNSGRYWIDFDTARPPKDEMGQYFYNEDLGLLDEQKTASIAFQKRAKRTTRILTYLIILFTFPIFVLVAVLLIRNYF